MTIDFLVPADAADTANGKLYLLGACWNQHSSPAFPAHIRLAVALTVTLEKTELGNQYKLSVNIFDPDHKPVVPAIEAQIRAPASIATKRAVLPLALNLSFPLPRPGLYTIEAQCEDATKVAEFESFLAS